MCFVESFSNEKTEVDIMGRKMNKKEVEWRQNLAS